MTADNASGLRSWMRTNKIWHKKLFDILESRNISNSEELGQLSSKEFKQLLKEAKQQKFQKPKALQTMYNDAKPKKKKTKISNVNDNDNDNANANANENEVENENTSTTNTTPKKKKKKKSKKKKSKSKSNKPERKSVKQMMADYQKMKPAGAVTNDTVSFMGQKANADEDNED